MLTEQILYDILYECSARAHKMREWLSGGAPPCQGGGRGFESRLALYKNKVQISSQKLESEFFFCHKMQMLQK